MSKWGMNNIQGMNHDIFYCVIHIGAKGTEVIENEDPKTLE